MHRRSSFILSIATGFLALSSFGCSPSGTGTTVESGGSPSSGGQPGTGGVSGTGGQPGTGGAPGTGGKAGSGGATDSGGRSGSGGATSAGGTTTGGSTGSGGATSNGGAIGDAGRPDVGRSDGVGRPDSGPATTGGGPGNGGATSSGGTSGASGSTGTGAAVKKYFGNIDTAGQIRSDFKSMWDQFSPENAGKWGSVQGGGQSSFSWGSLDTMYKYTQDNNILFKEHCFCWGAQQPSWVNNTNGQAAVKAWMKAFCDRYPKVAIIDVFNESLHNSPAYKDALGGAGTSGYDWIANAFKYAREACPNAILLYNDYNTIEYANENGGVIKLVNAIKGAGAPIDGVGCQGHDVAKVSASTVTGYVDKIISQTGLPVHITEMDIGVADDTQQAQIMKDIVTPLWANANVKGMTYWGYIVGNTWRANTGLMTSSGTKRPALTWLMSFLSR
ncbi:MAG TPA: endo-1,4-beta-xylanase [Polyangia bacterium]